MKVVQLRHFAAGLAIFSCLVTVRFIGAEPRPMLTMQGESLSGHEVVFPNATAGHPAVIVIGFSHNSSRIMEHWDKQIGAQVTAKPGVPLYNVAVLQDAPRLVRSMITHSIKALVPAAGHDRFLTVTQGEEELKKAVDFSDGDNVYVLVLDGSGNIVYRTQGEPSEDSKRQVIEELK